MAKSKTTSSEDLIQMHWGTICFEVCDKTVRSGLQDLEILELDESPDPVRTAFVQFSGETSKETAIQTLRQIIEAIERDGLPETTQRMLRKYGTVIMQMQQHLEKAHEIAQELPPELRECSLFCSQALWSPGPPRISKSVSTSWAYPRMRLTRGTAMNNPNAPSNHGASGTHKRYAESSPPVSMQVLLRCVSAIVTRDMNIGSSGSRILR